MKVTIYNTEEEMPKYLRANRSETWNILDKMEWDEWNYVPSDTPQKSKFHNHVTWNSHRQDYFIKMNIYKEEERAAERRIANDNKFGSADDYAQELKDAAEEEARWAEEEALEALEKQPKMVNTILPTPQKEPEYIPFKKMTLEQKKAKRKLRNAKYYAKNKTKINNDYVDAPITKCKICGIEHRDHPRGVAGHIETVAHQSELILHKTANLLVKKKGLTLEEALLYIKGQVTKTEDKLNRKLSAGAVKRKYENLLAQYSS